HVRECVVGVAELKIVHEARRERASELEDDVLALPAPVRGGGGGIIADAEDVAADAREALRHADVAKGENVLAAEVVVPLVELRVVGGATVVGIDPVEATSLRARRIQAECSVRNGVSVQKCSRVWIDLGLRYVGLPCKRLFL